MNPSESEIAQAIRTLRAIGQIGVLMKPLMPNYRAAVLLSALAQELCMRSPADRVGALEAVQDDLPKLVRMMEETMRKALVANAKAGL